jgi:hypothetical protein
MVTGIASFTETASGMKLPGASCFLWHICPQKKLSNLNMINMNLCLLSSNLSHWQVHLQAATIFYQLIGVHASESNCDQTFSLSGAWELETGWTFLGGTLIPHGGLYWVLFGVSIWNLNIANNTNQTLWYYGVSA